MRSELVEVVARQGGVFTRSQALDAGHSAADVRRLLRSGRWSAVRRGIYMVSPQGVPPGSVCRAAAARLALGGRGTVSHRTAAELHGIVLLDPGPVTELTLPPGDHRPGHCPGMALHAAELPTDHVTSGHGLPVTTVERTIIDLGRTLPFRAAVVAADSALRSARADQERVRAVLRDCAGWPGIRQAARVVELADARAESPLESLCRAVFHEHGMPRPDLQTLVCDPHDGWWARVDFLWEEHGTVVEADGMAKYTGLATLREEKLRQERIEELGYAVVRVIWAQVTRDPVGTVARIRRAFVRGRTLRHAWLAGERTALTPQ